MTTQPAAAATDSAERLLRLAARGDHAAFARIVRLHHADMVRVAYAACGSTDLAEEAAAAAWPIAWRRLDSVREPDRLRAWLCTVAVNEARQAARRRRRTAVREVSVHGLDPDAAPGTGRDPSERVADLDLLRALDRLEPDDRALLALRYVAGLNSTELAKATRLTPSGTRARLARLLDRLRAELDDD